MENIFKHQFDVIYTQVGTGVVSEVFNTHLNKLLRNYQVLHIYIKVLYLPIVTVQVHSVDFCPKIAKIMHENLIVLNIQVKVNKFKSYQMFKTQDL